LVIALFASVGAGAVGTEVGLVVGKDVGVDEGGTLVGVAWAVGRSGSVGDIVGALVTTGSVGAAAEAAAGGAFPDSAIRRIACRAPAFHSYVGVSVVRRSITTRSLSG
jgi:hypothetical protein